MKDNSYPAVMSRSNQIMKKALGMDYQQFEGEGLVFDYERMMKEAAYTLEEIIEIQQEGGVGNTPLLELKNLTQLARKTSPPGKGARIFIKDEAANPSGSFKARRAAVSVYHAKEKGYLGVVSATSGNYGAAVASQAAIRGLDCIVVQEVFDSQGDGQPEILEKGRKCEALGAEVLQLTVGPELFYVFLQVLEETGFFNASLYTPFGIAGIETLGYEVAMDIKAREGRFPTEVLITNAGGGNLTGTARGLAKAGAHSTKVVGVSVDLTGLHMASDRDFNRKSFTTGHTGFGVPFATWPDRADVPRNAARPLRYMDRYLWVTQGEVFYMTEALARVEGLERGPAGNISLAAAFARAREMEEDDILVVQETEYTGAGKHPTAQLTFAREKGIQIKRGDPRSEIPGKSIVIPRSPEDIQVQEMDLNKIKGSFIRNAIKVHERESISQEELAFLVEETASTPDFVRGIVTELQVQINQ